MQRPITAGQSRTKVSRAIPNLPTVPLKEGEDLRRTLDLLIKHVRAMDEDIKALWAKVKP